MVLVSYVFMESLLGLTLTEQLGLNIFLFSIGSAFFLYWVDRTERANFSLPFGRSIPYTLAILGGGVMYFASEGPFGLAQAVALALFIGFVMQEVTPLLKKAD